MQKLFCAGVLFLAIVLYIDNGSSLKCYQCRSDKDKGCNPPINSNFSINCTEKTPAYCRKISQKLRFKDQSSFTNIRECAYHVDKLDCVPFKWYKIAIMKTCECDTDNCNRGSSRAPGIIAVVFSLLSIFLHLKSNSI